MYPSNCGYQQFPVHVFSKKKYWAQMEENEDSGALECILKCLKMIYTLFCKEIKKKIAQVLHHMVIT